MSTILTTSIPRLRRLDTKEASRLATLKAAPRSHRRKGILLNVKTSMYLQILNNVRRTDLYVMTPIA
jgi:hypothetical protein